MATTKPFKIEKHDRFDKQFEINGPDIRLFVDNDDVDQKTVAREARKLVAILNKHWEDNNDTGTDTGNS